jgi:hypothetical protein
VQKSGQRSGAVTTGGNKTLPVVRSLPWSAVNVMKPITVAVAVGGVNTCQWRHLYFFGGADNEATLRGCCGGIFSVPVVVHSVVGGLRNEIAIVPRLLSAATTTCQWC